MGQNSADASRLLDRLEFLQEMDLSPDILSGIPPHRVTRLQLQGERYLPMGCATSAVIAAWPSSRSAQSHGVRHLQMR